MTAETAPALILRERLLGAMLAIAATQGWNSQAVAAAAKAAGLSAGEAALAAPRGAIDLIDAFAAEADRGMAAALARQDLAAMKVRERVTLAVRLRIEATMAHKEAARRAMARLALGSDAAMATRMAWRTADAIWRALGDPSTDGNYYSKRAILAGVFSAVFSVWLIDRTPDSRRTWDFLAARIENVMQFERFKAARLAPLGAAAETAIGELARWRYRAAREA
jgi:ubiquinone biosynthesis protein COQ9